MGAGKALCSAGYGVDGRTQNAEVRLGLGTIIEPKDSLHGALQFGGQTDAAFTNAIGVATQDLLREGNAKRLLHRSDSSGEFDNAALRLWCALFNGQPKFFGERAHQCDRGRIGRMLLTVLSAREAIFAQAFSIERLLAADDHRNSEDAAGACRLFFSCRGQSGLFTTGENHTLLGRKARGGCFGSHGEFSPKCAPMICRYTFPRKLRVEFKPRTRSTNLSAPLRTGMPVE